MDAELLNTFKMGTDIHLNDGAKGMGKEQGGSAETKDTLG